MQRGQREQMKGFGEVRTTAREVAATATATATADGDGDAYGSGFSRTNSSPSEAASSLPFPVPDLRIVHQCANVSSVYSCVQAKCTNNCNDFDCYDCSDDKAREHVIVQLPKRLWQLPTACHSYSVLCNTCDDPIHVSSLQPNGEVARSVDCTCASACKLPERESSKSMFGVKYLIAVLIGMLVVGLVAFMARVAWRRYRRRRNPRPSVNPDLRRTGSTQLTLSSWRRCTSRHLSREKSYEGIKLMRCGLPPLVSDDNPSRPLHSDEEEEKYSRDDRDPGEELNSPFQQLAS